jgi:FtsH-binding integral membrane protein
MLIAAIAFPDIFRGKGRILLLALTAVIIVEAICAIFGVFMPEIWDVLVAGLFAFYIGYNWAIAQEYDCTIDNAIDACVGLYLNIVNLFLRVLSIMERDYYY